MLGTCPSRSAVRVAAIPPHVRPSRLTCRTFGAAVAFLAASSSPQRSHLPPILYHVRRRRCALCCRSSGAQNIRRARGRPPKGPEMSFRVSGGSISWTSSHRAAVSRPGSFSLFGRRPCCRQGHEISVRHWDRGGTGHAMFAIDDTTCTLLCDRPSLEMRRVTSRWGADAGTAALVAFP